MISSKFESAENYKQWQPRLEARKKIVPVRGLPFFVNMSGVPHYCNYCRNHGVVSRASSVHKRNCPWAECGCCHCTRLRRRNLLRRELRVGETGRETSSTDSVTTTDPLASVSAASVVAVANASGNVTSTTSAAAARAGKQMVTFLKDQFQFYMRPFWRFYVCF